MLNVNATRSTDFTGFAASFVEDTWSPGGVEKLVDSFVPFTSLKDALKNVFAPNPHDVQVPLDNGTPYVTGTGDVNSVDWDDVKQGNMGDCYLVATMAAIARENPDAIKNMITENRDASGNVTSYNVRLYQRNGEGRLERRDVTVDASQFSQNAARPGDSSGAQQEIWPLIIEKAYAQLNGGYSNIAGGGWPEIATETLTGIEANSHTPSNYGFDQLQRDLGAGRPVIGWTPGDDKKKPLLDGVGLVGNHAYAVVDTKVENGVQMVKVYNPWGHTQPGTAEADGGWMKYDDFQRLMSGVSVGGSVNTLRLQDLLKDLNIFRGVFRG
jgi:hypothetical protein